MKKLPLLVIILSVLFFSCKKNTAKCPYTVSGAVATQTEKDSIQRYLNANGITATRDTSGVYYQVIKQGTGSAPTVCSNVTVKYRGTFFTGVAFDPSPASGNSTSSASFALGQVIVGWQKTLPYLKSGGSIDLYIPPSLGYGYSPYSTIPGGSYLKFTIELVDVQ